jgi:uncharacterized membrane protein
MMLIIFLAPRKPGIRAGHPGDAAGRGRHGHGIVAPPMTPVATTAPVAAPLAAAGARPRLDSIDLVRGVVMAIMVLDHVRDYLGGSAVNPRDVADPALFLTRWITHLCAPTFVFLAGVSAYLYGHRGRSRGEISRFLLTRGLWLMVLELTVVRFAWTFKLVPDFLFLQVIWAIGAGMVVLAGLVYLPRWAIAAFGLAVIGGHNALDSIRAADLGSAGWLWNLAHEPAMLRPLAGLAAFALYPLIPWIGVIAAGYALGPVFTQPAAQRTRTLLLLGAGTLGLFAVLRFTGGYGDPAARVAHDGALPWFLSFINCEKYPPSLLYLAMTIGVALLLLVVAERARGVVAGWLVTMGRVPMLFYVAHIVLVHLAAIAYALIVHGDAGWLFGGLPPMNKPEGFGLSLPMVYVAWLVILTLLYPLCRWFAALRRRRTDWWLSYL